MQFGIVVLVGDNTHDALKDLGSLSANKVLSIINQCSLVLYNLLYLYSYICSNISSSECSRFLSFKELRSKCKKNLRIILIY